MKISVFANLDLWPAKRASKPIDAETILTLGDAHGNPIKIIYFLIYANVMVMSKEDYQKLITLYETPVDDITLEHLNEFSELLAKSTIHPSTIDFLGDLLYERGLNDAFTLLVLSRLSKEPHCKIIINFSNHDAEFFNAGFCLINNEEHQPIVIELANAPSFKNLKKLMDKKIIDLDWLLNLTREAYLPYLKLYSYSISPNNQTITFRSHAPNGFNTISNVCKALDIPYEDQTVEKLATTLDAINHKFLEELSDNKIDQTILTAVWQRYTDIAFLELLSKDKEQLTFKRNNYYVEYLHGHDNRGEVPKKYELYVTNYDSLLGKFPEDKMLNRGYLTFDYEPSKLILEKRLEDRSLFENKADLLLFKGEPPFANETKMEKEKFEDTPVPIKLFDFRDGDFSVEEEEDYSVESFKIPLLNE